MELARGVAKEARRTIASEALYGPKVLDDFTDALTPVFQGPKAAR